MKIILPVLALLAAGCSPAVSPGVETDSILEQTSPPATPANPRSELPGELFSLGFDTIRPVYQPEFAPADQAPIQDDELVIGIAFDGEARAYPVTVLRFREIVNDELAGIPVLVTW